MGINWCCDSFKSNFGQSPERGIRIIAVESTPTPLFCLLSKALDDQDRGQLSTAQLPFPVSTVHRLGIQCCPWCGTLLADHYSGDNAPQLLPYETML